MTPSLTAFHLIFKMYGETHPEADKNVPQFIGVDFSLKTASALHLLRPPINEFMGVNLRLQPGGTPTHAVLYGTQPPNLPLLDSGGDWELALHGASLPASPACPVTVNLTPYGLRFQVMVPDEPHARLFRSVRIDWEDLHSVMTRAADHAPAAARPAAPTLMGRDDLLALKAALQPEWMSRDGLRPAPWWWSAHQNGNLPTPQTCAVVVGDEHDTCLSLIRVSHPRGVPLLQALAQVPEVLETALAQAEQLTQAQSVMREVQEWLDHPPTSASDRDLLDGLLRQLSLVLRPDRVGQ